MNALQIIQPSDDRAGESVKKSTVPATELFELRAAMEASKKAAARKERKRGLEIRKGSIVVKIFGHRGKGPFTIAWRESAGGPRKRVMRSRLDAAKLFASEKATNLANGELTKLAFGPQDHASYLRACELLLPTGKPLELAASEYVEFTDVLREAGMKASEAFGILRAHVSKAKIIPKLCRDIVNEFLEAKRTNTFGERHSGSKWVRTLTSQLTPFGEYFSVPLQLVTAGQMEAWLNSLKVVGKTRKGYRTAISGLVSFAKAKKYLAPDWDQLKDVPVPRCDKVKKTLFTPEEMTRMLARAPGKMIPFMTLGSFGGVRHEEMNPEDQKKIPLDWRDVGTKIIRIREETSKTGEERFITMPENLIKWLTPYRKPNGPVCVVANTSNALDRIKKKAGIKAGKNETRNGFRKSWETYSEAIKENLVNVSGEAGHSQAVAKKNYISSTFKEEAQRWFTIVPSDSEILQLNFGLK